MKYTLQLGGREMTFTEEELTELAAFVEEHFARIANEHKAVPTEGKWFEVNPQTINQELFLVERKDKKQEETRRIIQEAFEVVDECPERYGKPFETLQPKKTWWRKTAGELRDLATNLGDHMANWVEQALEWAQRIHNGESWEDVCNRQDTANWYRLVVWKEDLARLIGGSVVDRNNNPASDVSRLYYHSIKYLYVSVPLVVRYSK